MNGASFAANLDGFDSEYCVCGCDYYRACAAFELGGRAVFSDRKQARLFLEYQMGLGHAVAGHNLRSDFAALGHYPDCRRFDSLVLSWLWDENGSHKLKELAPRVLGRKLEDPITMKKGTDGQGPITLFNGVHIPDAEQDEVTHYCTEDARASRDLVLEYWPILPPVLKKWYEAVEEPLDHVVWDMERRGLAIDEEKLLAETYEFGKLTAEAVEKVYAEVGYRFDINSNQQLGKVLFTKEWTDLERGQVGWFKTCGEHNKPIDHSDPDRFAEYGLYKCGCGWRAKEGWVPVTRKGFGLRPGKKTPTGQPSVDDEALQNYVEASLVVQHGAASVVRHVLDYREADKILGTYLKAFPKRIRNGRLYGSFNPVGTVTGRFSSSNPNLQNIPIRGPLGKRVRNLFVAAPGCVLVVADLDQIELRLLAQFSKCAALLGAFAIGEDVHQATANVLGTSRTLAKNGNYCLSYGGGVNKLAKTAECPVSEARAFMREHRRAYPELYRWKERVIEFGKRHGYVVTLGRRRRHLLGLFCSDPGKRAEAERQAVNSVIQGSAADLMRVAMVRMADDRATGYCLPVLAQVHDEVIVEAPTGSEETACRLVKASFEESSEVLGLPDWLVSTEPKVVGSWGEAK